MIDTAFRPRRRSPIDYLALAGEDRRRALAEHVAGLDRAAGGGAVGLVEELRLPIDRRDAVGSLDGARIGPVGVDEPTSVVAQPDRLDQALDERGEAAERAADLGVLGLDLRAGQPLAGDVAEPERHRGADRAAVGLEMAALGGREHQAERFATIAQRRDPLIERVRGLRVEP